MKKIVISAVNFNEGGPLSVLKDCLKAFEKIYKHQDLDITVFVHKIHLVREYTNDFKIIEYPLIKTSWFKRLYFEYYQCKEISKKIKPDLWIALHDMTPNVTCEQVVYCHNPSPFYNLKFSDAFTDTTFFSFCLFYSFLYRINIKKNKYVVVQQQWLREEFERRYNVKTIVAYPDFIATEQLPMTKGEIKSSGRKYLFFFPAFPRVAKNFETLLKAAKTLAFKRKDFELIITINGTENKYAQKIYADYRDIDQVKFIGSKTRDEVFNIYSDTDCLVFPSKLETWGLPISEFKIFNKPMLLSDMKYAHETAGNYQSVKFFDPDDAQQLSNYMELIIDNKLIFDVNKKTSPGDPYFNNWNELVKFLVKQTAEKIALT